MEAGEVLLKKGLLDPNQVEQSRRAQTDGMRLDEAAVRLGFLSEVGGRTGRGGWRPFRRSGDMVWTFRC